MSRIAASRASSILLEGETGTRQGGDRQTPACPEQPRPQPVCRHQLRGASRDPARGRVFGYEKGAFTDARSAKPGLVEDADGGTLFLDEIGEMPLGLQAKLLRVLEERELRRLGGIDDIRLDMRVVAATNRNLPAAIEHREFRSDLYYRLNVVQIQIPALRERPDDIEDLALHFLDYFNHVHLRNICGLHPRALAHLMEHSWPGNVRELRNVIERAVLMETSSSLTSDSINLPLTPARTHRSTEARNQHAPLCLRSTERDMISTALKQAAGNRTRAAALLGIGRFSLRYKMRKLGLL